MARPKALRCRGIVVVDPDPAAAERAAAAGADGVEIDTGGKGAGFARGDQGAVLERGAAEPA